MTSYVEPSFEMVDGSTWRVKPSMADKQSAISDPRKYASFEHVYHSYAGVDIVASIVMPNEDGPLILGELQTISYSIHRENTPVRLVGHTNVRSFVKGPRTIAGSLIFTQFNQYAFYRLQQFKFQVARGLYPLSDMLPPFDVLLTFSNETGAFSKMKILGLTIVDEGGTMSVDDLMTEQTFTYMARGIIPMVSYVPDGYEQVHSISPDPPILRPRLEFR